MHLCIYASIHLCIYASMRPCIYASMHLCTVLRTQYAFNYHTGSNIIPEGFNKSPSPPPSNKTNRNMIRALLTWHAIDLLGTCLGCIRHTANLFMACFMKQTVSQSNWSASDGARLATSCEATGPAEFRSASGCQPQPAQR